MKIPKNIKTVLCINDECNKRVSIKRKKNICVNCVELIDKYFDTFVEMKDVTFCEECDNLIYKNKKCGYCNKNEPQIEIYKEFFKWVKDEKNKNIINDIDKHIKGQNVVSVNFCIDCIPKIKQ